MTVKRYTPTQCCEHDGTYVTYSDYQKLVAENAALRRIAVGYHILTVPEREAPTEPEIDAAISEIKNSGAEELLDRLQSAIRMVCNPVTTDEIMDEINEVAANLRSGRKG